MTREEVFQNALWLSAAEQDGAERWHFPVLRGRFCVHGVKKATLYVLGLGFFHCYLNGKRVGEDLFLPLNSDYEPRPNYPEGEILSGHRVYVPQYDVTGMLKEGENLLALHFGGGWYTFEDARFGGPKAIWRIFGEDENGPFSFVSSTEDRIHDSFVKDGSLPSFETQDYLSDTPESFGMEFDDSAWEKAVPAPPLETEYLFSDCPADRVCARLSVRLLGTTEDGHLYDCGQNTTGYPVLKLLGKRGETVTVRFSEELTPEGTLNPYHAYRQRVVYRTDGEARTVRPLFTWFGFRYFTVSGDAEVLGVEVVHSDVRASGFFESDNPLLNWLHDTFRNTQLTNMHAGIPSDCPHIERRGYTGDGQLVCHAAMDLLDAESFYRKWISDIADCQDKLSGHVQYTAPYTRCGGGPGGWGCAIVEVPYQYYRHYGKTDLFAALYPGMLRYFDYLEAHSCRDVVVSDQEGAWCLGDWCTPESILLPPPFVNNYFYVRSLLRVIELAALIGKEADIPLLEERAARKKETLTACYFDPMDGNFLGCRQGANAFMLDIGLGDERTYRNLVAYYRNLKRFDTGIFGTEIVTRLLFERGDGQLAVDLLLSEDKISYDGMRRAGATTIWEYWPGSLYDRSHNHPMFGAAVACLYDYLLGIGGSAGYRKLVIAPVLAEGIGRLAGGREIPGGRVTVFYEKRENTVSFRIGIPEEQTAVFVFAGERYPLTAGENFFEFPMPEKKTAGA